MLRIPIILGSATPALESWYNASSGKYQLLEMPRRVTAHDLPIVTIVPLQADFYRLDGSGLITDQLDMLIRQRLAAREQILLFLNRRGFATYLHCVRCGFIMKCPECDITLTFHRSQNAARCHYCGHRRELPPTCPDCEMPGIRRAGVGTEKVVAELGRRYDEACVARLDRDTVSSHRGLRSTIASFARGDFNILVGTQMVAKGHDFPQVTLVGIINADTGLHFADFRAAERTFQLITQVSGRAGRGTRAGRVVIQSFFPDHFAVRLAANGEFSEFCRRELEFRKALGYPPFGRLVKILFHGPAAERVDQEAQRTAAFLREGEKSDGSFGLQKPPGCRVLGPAPSPISKIQGKHRRQILLKSPSPSSLHSLLHRLEKGLPKPARGVERAIDIDPQSML
jgi:primosomal protein N' (replication factor Y)